MNRKERRKAMQDASDNVEKCLRQMEVFRTMLASGTPLPAADLEDVCHTAMVCLPILNDPFRKMAVYTIFERHLREMGFREKAEEFAKKADSIVESLRLSTSLRNDVEETKEIWDKYGADKKAPEWIANPDYRKIKKLS